MKKFTLTAISLIFMVTAYGQARRGQSPVKFVYDVDFQYYLDNSEYAVSNYRYDISQTFNSARPQAGSEQFRQPLRSWWNRHHEEFWRTPYFH